MKTLLIAVTVLVSSALHAREFRLLREIQQEFSKIYSEQGNDNNFLAYTYFDTDDLAQVKHKLPEIKISEISYTEAFSVIKKCVFMGAGAYGLHITSSQQNKLTKKLLKTFSEDFILSPTLYFVENIELELINNRCALMARGPLNHEIIILQGVSID